ncbi:MAG: glycosyltransferase family 4 protein [Gemmatimonadaceae bacterium]
MICLLHGWLLEGSGSNLWTRSIITALSRSGETVHLVCQENHPYRYDVIAEAYRYRLTGEVEMKLQRDTRYPGKCILHQPEIGETLPVFVKDKYEEYDRVVPMIELPDDEIEQYIERNVAVVRKIVEEHDITAIHANHVVLMAVVAQRVSKETGVPYVIMPHGSGIEYAVKKDDRFRRYASSALSDAGRIFVIGAEMRDRVVSVFNELPGIESKFTELHLGVDASQFEPVARENRQQSIDSLARSLTSTPRGKTALQSRTLEETVSGILDRNGMKAAIADNARYDGKSPDADVEDKLHSVDWSRDPVLLFTGRIISPKGIQCVIAALPLILQQVPDLRLIIVGHGPLREPLEAMVQGLRTGDRALVRNIIAWGRWVEGAPEGDDSSDDIIELTRFFDRLAQRGEEEKYFESAQGLLKADTVIFTGYLTHRELRFLFPCCDVGVFPSIVREAGPLVFLEAIASGTFPLGTYFGGMAASIDAVSADLPAEVGATMKLGLADTVDDLVRQVPRAFDLGTSYRNALASIARERYDWVSVAGTLREALYSL